MNKKGAKSMETTVAGSAETSTAEKIRKVKQESEAGNREEKYARIEIVKEIDHEYIQQIMGQRFFSVTDKMQLEKDNGINYPDKFAYPVTINAFKAALDNAYCRYLIQKLILRGYNATMGLFVSPHYQEYHVIAKETANRYYCIVTNDDCYDHMCWGEWVDMGTLRTYTRWTPVPLMELAKQLQITIGL